VHDGEVCCQGVSQHCCAFEDLGTLQISDAAQNLSAGSFPDGFSVSGSPNGTTRVMQYLRRNGPEESTSKDSVPMGWHHYEICPILRISANRLGGISHLEEQLRIAVQEMTLRK
jgi:hypothetical protein